MKAVSLLTLILLTTGQKSVREPYYGPLDLKWGQSQAESIAALEGRLELVSVSGNFVAFSGHFADMATEGVALVFGGEGLAGVIVIMAQNDVRPKSIVWRDIVALMTKTYGEPDEISKPPTLPHEALKSRRSKRAQELGSAIGSLFESVGPDIRDSEIKKGSWSPMAIWRFPNAAEIQVYVKADQPNEYGDRPLAVFWTFADKTQAKASQEAARDF